MGREELAKLVYVMAHAMLADGKIHNLPTLDSTTEEDKAQACVQVIQEIAQKRQKFRTNKLVGFLTRE